MTMKPKFRIGDRVRKTETGEQLTVIDIGHYSFREDDPFTYLLADDMGGFDGGHSSWFLSTTLELVGCGIPAPALRWDEVTGIFYGHIFQYRFRIKPSNGTYVPYLDSQPVGSFYETLGEAKDVCQAYWQELWDKEMLLSRRPEPLQDK
jgi:hypothetical protein